MVRRDRGERCKTSLGSAWRGPCKILPCSEIALSPMMLQGYFRVLNLFDVAEAIELDKLRALLGPEAAPLPPAFRHRTPEYSQVQQAPIVESVGSITLRTGEKLDAGLNIIGLVSQQLSLRRFLNATLMACLGFRLVG
jgi:hypothetical protein